ncbi:helix-turn-helix domain-containing protein [Microbacterium sp. A93]|uniref:helix-turn-helix domain-containing protein n=1 Tax=Microbacterium sp. A93 TaxID=3450716 RepID=UPI003F43B336
MRIGLSLRRAREREGVSLRQASIRAVVTPSSLSLIENGLRDPTATTVERLAASFGLRVVPLSWPTGHVAVADVAEAISDALERDDEPHAYRALLELSNIFDGLGPFERVLIAIEAPLRITPHWDAAIAGVVEWKLVQGSAPLPQWVKDCLGTPDEDWQPRRVKFPIALEVHDVPEPLRRRGVHVGAAELAGV